jgi:hypothetical protein
MVRIQDIPNGVFKVSWSNSDGNSLTWAKSTLDYFKMGQSSDHEGFIIAFLFGLSSYELLCVP